MFVGWHLLADGVNGQMLLHNVFLGKGWTSSMSAIATSAPGVVTPYQWAVTTRGPEDLQHRKEQVWDAVRQRISPDLPSRMGAFFCFTTKEGAEAALADQRWFKDSGRVLLRVVIPPTATLHVADAKWLDTFEVTWLVSAEKYWRGDLTSTPVREMLVQGQIYFPDWEEPPFGLLKP